MKKKWEKGNETFLYFCVRQLFAGSLSLVVCQCLPLFRGLRIQLWKIKKDQKNTKLSPAAMT